VRGSATRRESTPYPRNRILASTPDPRALGREVERTDQLLAAAGLEIPNGATLQSDVECVMLTQAYREEKLSVSLLLTLRLLSEAESSRRSHPCMPS